MWLQPLEKWFFRGVLIISGVWIVTACGGCAATAGGAAAGAGGDFSTLEAVGVVNCVDLSGGAFLRQVRKCTIICNVYSIFFFTPKVIENTFGEKKENKCKCI